MASRRKVVIFSPRRIWPIRRSRSLYTIGRLRCLGSCRRFWRIAICREPRRRPRRWEQACYALRCPHRRTSSICPFPGNSYKLSFRCRSCFYPHAYSIGYRIESPSATREESIPTSGLCRTLRRLSLPPCRYSGKWKNGDANLFMVFVPAKNSV